MRGTLERFRLFALPIDKKREDILEIVPLWESHTFESVDRATPVSFGRKVPAPGFTKGRWELGRKRGETRHGNGMAKTGALGETGAIQWGGSVHRRRGVKRGEMCSF